MELIVKRRHTMILALMLVAASAAASSAGEVSFGAKGGVIIANVTGIPEGFQDSQDYRTSFTGGIIVNYAFNEEFSLQPELLYVPKGFKGFSFMVRYQF